MSDHLDLTSQRFTPDLRISAWLLEPGSVTGSYLGDGVLTSKDLVVLHPGAARAALAAGPPPRLRVAVQTPWALYVTDGTVMVPGTGATDALMAVELDWPIAEETTPIPFDPESGDFDAIVRWLHEQAQAAPTDEPDPPQATGYRRGEPPVRAGARDAKPWWCQVWPGCWGC